ncbi:MAG: DUF4288 domain-containing protein [Ferruginibacter sp.]
MKWYLAKLVFRIICANGDHKPQFDEQLRLVNAEDDLHAFHKARLIGDTENVDGITTLVKWKFIDVSELHLLSEFTDGAEIYSKVMEEEEPDRYIGHIQKRATQLLQHGLHQFTEVN